MPSATGMAQEGENVRRPSICTAHRKHDAAGSTVGTWHIVGMRMPSHRAASSTEVSGGTVTRRPSMVRVIISEGRLAPIANPCTQPEGRKRVAHGAQAGVAGWRRLPAPERGVRRATALVLPPRPGAEAKPSFSQCWRTGLLSVALRAGTHEKRRGARRKSWAHHLNRIVLARLPAHVAARAQALVHLVPLIRTIRDGAHRAGLRAQRAPDAVGIHPVTDEGGTAARGAAPFEEGLIFLAKVPQRGQHRVGRRLPEPAQAAAADAVGQGGELFQVVAPALSRAEPFQNLQHSLGADAAEGTLAAGFRLGKLEEEARDVRS